MANSGWWTLCYYPPAGESIGATGDTLQAALRKISDQATRLVPEAENTARVLSALVEELSHVRV